jgi:large subunit ribosomal protein L22
MEAVAKLKGVQMSARKMRLVVDLIRGKNAYDALDILRFTKKEAAVWLEKLLVSAISNWEHKLGGAESADDYDLIIKSINSDQGAMLKRFRPAPHGRAHRIRKHSCHVTIVVENSIPLPDDAKTLSDIEDPVTVEEVE